MARKERFPDFLIIGSMKSGTTTLFNDLDSQPGIFMPSLKEPAALASDEIMSRESQRKYATLFRKAKDSQICGEASTHYTKRPDFENSAQRARKLLGERLKLIYLVRNPVDRTISHHYHEYMEGNIGPDVNSAIRSHNSFIAYSKYGMQIDPWLQQFGRQNILIVRFEDYMKNRRQGLKGVLTFLGVDFVESTIDVSTHYNASAEKFTLPSTLGSMATSHSYHRYIRPLLPESLRSKMKLFLGRKMPTKPLEASAGTIRYIIDNVQVDLREFESKIGAAGPLWNLDEPVAS